MDFQLEEKYQAVVRDLAKVQGLNLDMQSIIFLIGVRELGEGTRKFSKKEKLDLMHISICKLLEPFGFYTFSGNDDDGWPHYKRNKELPHLESKEQQELLKRAIVDYFEEL